MADSVQGSAQGHLVGAEKLRQYWLRGEGALKIRWGTPGDFTRCVRELEKYMPGRSEGYCANLHHRATGKWPGHHLGENPDGPG